eukprot:2209427-Prymnesium_polylepis.1
MEFHLLLGFSGRCSGRSGRSRIAVCPFSFRLPRPRDFLGSAPASRGVEISPRVPIWGPVPPPRA